MDAKNSILIVDDDPNLTKTLSDIIRLQGYAPLAVAKGKTAVNIVKEERPAVALIDLKLPDMDGLEVMREIKKRSPSTECIILTGYASQESAIESVSLDAYGYMQKPYNVEQLVVTIRRAVEKREGEEALRESDERYRDLYEEAPIAYFSVGGDGRIQMANGRAAALLRCTLDDLVGRPVFDLYADTPTGKGKAEKAFTRFRAGEEIRGEELEMRRPDGSQVWISLSVRPILDAEGQVVASRSMVVDITERKRAEEEISRLAKFPSENPNPVLRVARDGTIIYANEAALPLLNVWGCQEGQPLPDDLRQFTLDVFSSGLSKDTEVEHENRMLSLTFAPVVDADYVNVYGLDITERKRAEEELQHTLEKLRSALGGIIQAVTLTVEARDPYTAGHQQRATNLARAIADEMGLSGEQIDGIRMAGSIHDLGKISVPADILNKPGRLTENEFAIIQTHPQVGYDILKTIEFPWPVAQIAHQHHERMDGSGYPQGLSGEEILLEARILAVADVVEAMSSHRPYRPALGVDKALEEISQNRDVLYDPEVVDACLKVFTEKGFKFG